MQLRTGMSYANAEAAFAAMMHMELRYPEPEKTRALLRNLLMRHRVAVDANVDHKVLHSKDARRRKTMEEHAKLAVYGGVGAASGLASAPELLFGDPLPRCDRWGDAVSHHLGGPIGPLEQHQTLGYEGRPSLPHAVTVPYAGRLGPHGLVNAQLRASALPVASYAEVLSDTVEAQFGKMLVDYGMAVHTGVGIERTPVPDEPVRDLASQQQDGLRHWPPRALRDNDTADAVAVLVEDLARAVERNIPARAQGRRVPELDWLGTASVDMYWRMSEQVLKRDNVKAETLNDFRALGVCCYVRFFQTLRELQRRAVQVAMISHTLGGTGRTRLAKALEQLAAVLVSCGA